MADLHNSKPTAPIYCTTTHHAPDPLRPRFTNHHHVATRSEGFIAHDKRMRGNKCRCLIQTLNLLNSNSSWPRRSHHHTPRTSQVLLLGCYTFIFKNLVCFI